MRARLLVLSLVGVLLFLVGCAEADRVVTAKGVGVADDGGRVLQLVWTSEAYGRYVYQAETSDAAFRECYRQADVGASLPTSCLSLRLLRADTDAFGRNAWVAWGALFVFVGGVVLFALRRIAWVPSVAPSSEHQRSSAAAGTPDSAVGLMRSAELEKSSRAAAEADGYDIAHPGWVGVGVGLVPLATITLLFGYGTSLSWGRRPALLMLLGLGGVAMLLVLGKLQRSDMHPLIQRLQFLGGVAVSMVVVSVGGMALRGPLLELNGIAWPF